MPSDVAGARARSRRPSPRERLLKAADELFYAEGINSVGIDRVIERADVARASLYSTFGSKDELIRAYLEQRMEISKAALRAAAEAHDDPREAPAERVRRAGRDLRPARLSGLRVQPGHRRGPAGQRRLRGAPRLPPLAARLLRRTWPPRPGRPSPTSWPARSSCSTTARCWPRAWTATPASPRPPGRPPRPCSTRPLHSAALPGASSGRTASRSRPCRSAPDYNLDRSVGLPRPAGDAIRAPPSGWRHPATQVQPLPPSPSRVARRPTGQTARAGRA